MSAPAAAEPAAQLTSINGMAADGAAGALQSRGFTMISGSTNSMGYTYNYWWKPQDKTCVRTETSNGQVLTIADASSSDCHQGNGNAAAAVGVVAGAVLLGALLSHKSHHHDDDKHFANAQEEANYERGFTDGLHNAAYHNYQRSNAYSSGYAAGVDQRTANLGHHYDRGGYAPVTQFKDLQGARAAGGTEELGRRGFRQVDNFTSGDARYGIYWQPATRQCLQVIVANGRLEDIRDIQQHPKCR
ncbi:hypothetical protein [Sphingomonas sabuli]|nr:hypothetical protein [Sphingomonas sabuli]